MDGLWMPEVTGKTMSGSCRQSTCSGMSFFDSKPGAPFGQSGMDFGCFSSWAGVLGIGGGAADVRKTGESNTRNNPMATGRSRPAANGKTGWFMATFLPEKFVSCQKNIKAKSRVFAQNFQAPTALSGEILVRIFPTA